MTSNSDFRAVIFDLDGTLLDTLRDLADSMNAVLANHNFPTHPVDAYRYFVGDGVETLVKRTVPKNILSDKKLFENCLNQYRQQYAERWSDHAKPYPGIENMLKSLSDANIPTNVLSNKPQNMTTLNVKHYFPNHPFNIIRGLKPPTPKKPDPTSALQIAASLNLKPQQILYVGDTDTDMKTAVAAKMCPLAVLWGFRQEDELVNAGAHFLAKIPDDIYSLFSK